jgi:hypothetical protein
LDDLAGCESPEKSWDAFDNLGHILDRCGFEESVEKACPPNTKNIFVGILLDATNLTISIDEQRLAEISQLVLDWLTKQVCNKKELADKPFRPIPQNHNGQEYDLNYRMHPNFFPDFHNRLNRPNN